MISTIVKRILIALLLLITCLSILITHEWFAQKPFFFRLFMERSLLKLMLQKPQLLTSLGLFQSIGIKYHNALLDDISPAAADNYYRNLSTVRKELLNYSTDELSPKQQSSKAIALYLLNQKLAGESYQFHNYPLNPLFGEQSNYPAFMVYHHQIHSSTDARHYLLRLSKVTEKFSQTLRGLKLRESKDILPPKFVIERVLT